MYRLPDSLLSPRIHIIVGHTGSGKTEFAVNLALALAQAGRQTVLADLDVVNPYYRSRERRELLREQGIGLIASSQSCLDADIPSMPAELHRIFDDRSLTGVLDIGGSAAGARVLARYRPRILTEPHSVLFVLNGRRPATATVEGAIRSMEEIRQIMGLEITGIVNNTHLGPETDRETLSSGRILAREVSRETGLPLICHTGADETLFPSRKEETPFFPIHRYMKHPWEL